jgi:hypothetical protein
MRKLRSPNWLLVALVAGVIVLALVGVALLGAYFILSRQHAADAGWVNPVEVVQGKAVAPDLAILTLAGEPDDRIIRAALDSREPETAYATLTHSTLLPDNLRSGGWLLLARNYQQQDPARAEIGYQVALDLAALGPNLGDMSRADLSLQAARGYAALGKSQIARLALAQAENIGRYSLSLLPAQRRTLLDQVADVYQLLGDAASARTLREQIDAYAAGPGVTVPAGAPLLPTLRGGVVLPQSVASAMAARQQAAADLAARWLSSSSTSRETLTQALGRSLIDEDAAREEFYAGADTLPLSDRLALLHDKLAWLAVKYRAAQGGYGISLAPDWEAQVGDIRTTLASTYTELINGYGEQLDTLDASEAAQARVELLRQGVLWSRLGLFQDHAEETLSQQLVDASSQLWTRQGGAGLTLIVQDVGDRRLYLLSGSEPTKTQGQQ